MIILTGATGGIGLDLFKALSKKEKIIGIGNKSKIKGFENSRIINIDLLDHQQIDNFVRKYQKEFERITLIQLAVLNIDGLIANYKIEDARKLFELNFISNMALVKQLLPYMVQQKFGRIIHTSSIVANRGAVGAGIYAASKSALKGYSKTIAAEYGRFGITSNIINMGYFEKGLINSFNEKKIEKITNETPLKRLGKTNDIILAIDFIQKCDFFTGEELTIKGGYI